MKKLNLGCGADYKKGWINLDIDDNKDIYGRPVTVDVKHDLNKFPWPFKDNEFEKILMMGILEHIRDLEKGVKELARISKKGCVIKISVPYFMSYFAYRELYTHKFSLNSFQLFNIFKENCIELVSKKFVNNNRFLAWTCFFINQNDFTQNFYERFLAGIFPVNQIEWVMKVK